MSNFYDKISHGLVSELRPWWQVGLSGIRLSPFTLLGTTVVAVSWYLWLTKKSTRGMPPLPPGPPGLPLLGNLPFLQPDFHRYLAKLSQTYGPIIKLQLGSKICIVISSPSLTKIILKDHDTIFSNRDVPASAIEISYGGIDVAWSPNSPQWRKMRKIFVHNLMSHSSLDACYELRIREVRKMVKHIHEKVGLSIDIGEQTFLTVLSLTTSMLWGGAFQGEERRRVEVDIKEAVVEIVELVGELNISDLFPALARFDLQGIQKKMRKIWLWFDGIFESLVENRMKIEGSREETKDFLQLLLEMQQKEDEKTSLSLDQIKALLMDTIVVAPHTTSAAVEWAMAEMLRHPEKTRRVREEIEEVVGKHNIVEESHLPKLLYLDAVLKESLRLHPPAPLMVPRSPDRTCTVAGYTIPQGSKILFNTWAIQRDPKVWENPLEFEPERFLNDPGKGDYHGNNFSLFPFGSGRRICAGIPLAEKMMRYVVATLVHSFEWELPEGVDHDLSDKFGFVLKKSTPLVAKPTVRLPTAIQYL
ncbi:hypothetical protein SLEP1_g28101 [Rubroshorea leprosula]|uniref:Cytochrome P450 n=1 Tax=Rubroshorea leprosula TaxID=152421 RepID=A0AAV5JYL9_9ROSI|nr:hypothetical protein SLEP1_g28101 [Rubroshorea leprosula]